MKKSRLNLFKVTSMSISVLGIIMILATIALFAYIGITSLSSSISSDVGSSWAYDQLSVLKSNYNSLDGQFNSVKINVDNSNNRNAKNAFITAKLELVKANSTISDVDSALASGQSKSEVQDRITAAQAQLSPAQASLSNVRGML